MEKISYSNMKRNLLGYFLIAPAVLGILLMTIYPLISGVLMSFQEKNMVKSGAGVIGDFIGFTNYIALFKDEVFLLSLKNTAVWTISNLVLQMLLGVITALLLNQKLKARLLYRVSVLIPWIVPSVVAALNWRWMYDSKNGIINILLMKAGLITNGVTWLGETSSAMPAVIIESVWKGMPFVMLMVLAGLQTIPLDMYEAAHIDGANRFQILTKITIPFIKDSILIAGILTTIYTINNFNAIWLMTAGGPLDSTEILFTYAYKKAFLQYDFGSSAAISTIIFIIIVLLTTIYTRLLKKGDK